jgi:hypothetical protein
MFLFFHDDGRADTVFQKRPQWTSLARARGLCFQYNITSVEDLQAPSPGPGYTSCVNTVSNRFQKSGGRRNQLKQMEAGVAKLVDAQDLKSWGPQGPCRFESDPRYQSSEKHPAVYYLDFLLGFPTGVELPDLDVFDGCLTVTRAN